MQKGRQGTAVGSAWLRPCRPRGGSKPRLFIGWEGYLIDGEFRVGRYLIIPGTVPGGTPRTSLLAVIHEPLLCFLGEQAARVHGARLGECLLLSMCTSGDAAKTVNMDEYGVENSAKKYRPGRAWRWDVT